MFVYAAKLTNCHWKRMYFVAVDIISLFALMSFANFLDRTFSFLIHLFDGFDFGFGVFSRIYLFRSFAYFDFQ